MARVWAAAPKKTKKKNKFLIIPENLVISFETDVAPWFRRCCSVKSAQYHNPYACVCYTQMKQAVMFAGTPKPNSRLFVVLNEYWRYKKTDANMGFYIISCDSNLKTWALYILSKDIGRPAKARVVSRRPLNKEKWDRFLSSACRTWEGPSDNWKSFPRILPIWSAVIIPKILQTHSFIHSSIFQHNDATASSHELHFGKLFAPF